MSVGSGRVDHYERTKSWGNDKGRVEEGVRGLKGGAVTLEAEYGTEHTDHFVLPQVAAFLWRKYLFQ